MESNGHISKQDLMSYDRIIVAFSGGKDSLACILYLLERGVPEHKIELWHHDIDHGHSFMDWPVTVSYCKAVAKHLDIPIYYSWRVGGFKDELLRENGIPANIQFEIPDGLQTAVTIRAKPGTRLKFPMATNDMSRRWCSSYLKIDVGQKAVTHQERFRNSKLLFVTGERAQESANRAGYAVFEFSKRKSALIPRINRYVDAWRPVHSWKREDVWAIIERHSINPHPCYKLGWGRCSCACCIFSDANQWASLSIVCPDKVKKIADLECQFNKAIHYKRRSSRRIGEVEYTNISILDFAKTGKPFLNMQDCDIKCVNSKEYDQRISVTNWKFPAGAFLGESGPT